MADMGAEIDARAAVAAFHALARQAHATLAVAVNEAPLEAPDDAARKDRAPGRLRASGRIVYIVNETEYDGPDAETEAEHAIRVAARNRRLYRVDAELRFETAYARRQHDQLNLHHTTGKSKFLEDPIKQAAGTLVPGMRTEVGRAQVA